MTSPELTNNRSSFFHSGEIIGWVQNVYEDFVREQKKRRTFKTFSKTLGRAIPALYSVASLAAPPAHIYEVSLDAKGPVANNEYFCDVEYNIEGVGIAGRAVNLVDLSYIGEINENLNTEELELKYGEFSEKFPGVGLHYILPENTPLTNYEIRQLTAAVDNLKFAMELIQATDPELAKVFEGYANDRYEYLPEGFKLPILLSPQWLLKNEKTGAYVDDLSLCDALDLETNSMVSPEYAVVNLDEIAAFRKDTSENSPVWDKQAFAWVMHMLYHEFEHLYQTQYLKVDNLGERRIFYDKELMAEAGSIIFLNELSKRLNIPELGQFAFRDLVSSEVIWEHNEGKARFDLEIQSSPYQLGELLGVYGIESNITVRNFREYEQTFVEHISAQTDEELDEFLSRGNNVDFAFDFLRSRQYGDGKTWGEWLLEYTLHYKDTPPVFDNSYFWYERWNVNMADFMLDWELANMLSPAAITVNDFAFEVRENQVGLSNYVIPIKVPHGYEFTLGGVGFAIDAEDRAPLTPARGMVDIGAGTYYVIAARGIDVITITPK